MNKKLIFYSDLHLEFGDFILPDNIDGDVMILAGDIITFKDYSPLSRMLEKWTKPVLYVAGNHEYYNCMPMIEENIKFKEWLYNNHPNVIFLQDEGVTINGINFFGGTMWTDYNNSDEDAIYYGHTRMNDYRMIRVDKELLLSPHYTIKLHNEFVQKLLAWFDIPLEGERVIITHHAPTSFQDSAYIGSKLTAAYLSLDMIPVIKKYQPNIWIHGHTHECLKTQIGETLIISNQRGYKNIAENNNFDEKGIGLNIKGSMIDHEIHLN